MNSFQKAWRAKSNQWKIRQHQRRAAAEEARYLKEKAKLVNPSFAKRLSFKYQIWQNERREAQRIYEANNPEGVRRANRRKAIFFWLLILGLGGVFCFFLWRDEHSRTRGPQRPQTVVTVNGTPISRASLEQTLYMTYGDTVLQKLVQEQLIRQEAQRLKLSLTPEEEKKIQELLEKDPLARLHRPELTTALLLKKVAVKKASKERKEKIYQDFKQDLVQYTISGLRFSDKKAVQSFVTDLSKGLPWEQVAEKFSTDGRFAKPIGKLTLAQVRQNFGEPLAQELKSTQVGDWTNPLATSQGFAVYRLEKVGTSYADVESAIDDIVAGADAAQIVQDLFKAAKIDSSFSQPESSPSPQPESSPSAGKPTPTVTSTP